MVANGWRAITWEFLTQPPMASMTKGGILPCIVGTFSLSFGAIIAALPIGIASAIYLNEYARPGKVVRLIRLGINNLAGVPRWCSACSDWPFSWSSSTWASASPPAP
jgi:phosphate transport system permease protein